MAIVNDYPHLGSGVYGPAIPGHNVDRLPLREFMLSFMEGWMEYLKKIYDRIMENKKLFI